MPGIVPVNCFGYLLTKAIYNQVTLFCIDYSNNHIDNYLHISFRIALY